MSSSQKSVSIADKLEADVTRFMEMWGVKSFSGAIAILIHRGLGCTCRSGNNGGGVEVKQLTSLGKEIPKCFGKCGAGHCEGCKHRNLCRDEFVKICTSDKK